MSEVFYRKWRPRRLDQLVGQEAIARTLRNAVLLGRVAHAYLFCGPRGTGKTSTARILAKAVNCLSPQEGEPDDECAICGSINEGRALDLIEIDAASNRGIDDIRSLRDRVHFTPNEARYKVYIIDEVHMLTEPAFNALLKTLGEPPEHAIFVLATTEVHKVPLTIISRCQRFDFRRIPVEAALARLTRLCADEGIEAAPEALELIARASVGSLRDAENMLEQAVVSYGSSLSEDQVRDMLELGSDESALELVTHIVGKSVREGLGVINDVAGEGSDLRQFHRGLLEYLRGVLLAKSGAAATLGYAEETKARLADLADRASLDHLVRALKTFAGVEMRRDISSPLPLELALLESSLDAPVREVQERQRSPDPRAAPVRARDTVPVPPPAQPRPTVPAAPPPTRPEPSVAAGVPPAGLVEPAAPPPLPAGAQSEPAHRLASQWDSIVKALRTQKGKRFNLGALLRSSTQRVVEDGTITLKYSHTSHLERMQEELDDPEAGRLLRGAFEQAMQGPYEIRLEPTGGRRDGPGQSATQRSHLVRAAQAMGARVVGEKEEEREQEDDQAGPAAPEEHAQAPGGA